MIVTRGTVTSCPQTALEQPGRLLVVDDNVDYLKTLELLFENTKFDCDYCQDGPSAIDAARRREFDVLLVDVRMTPIDGVETARAVKSLQPQIGVIMMTGFDKEDTPLEALRLGAVDYIDKPITNAASFLRMLTDQVRVVQSAKQLRTTKERLETVIQQVDAGVVVLDAQGKIDDVNQAALNLVAPGRSESDVRGHMFHEVCQLPELLFLSPKDEPFQKTFDLVREGPNQLIQVSATRLQDASNRPAGMVLLLKDLTAIAESQKAEGWRQMSRAITHGMKTPLATLRMRLERLKTKPDCAPLEGDFNMLLGVVEELHARLRDMVDFVKLDIVPVMAELNQTIAGAIRHFEVHRRPTTRIAFRRSPDPLRVPHAPAALELAIGNLLSNSQEAASDEVNIEIELLPDVDHRQAVITVCDDGPGIPAELRGDVFRRPLNSTKPGGSGLGTALVKYIVDQHQGSLVWQSPASLTGRGTRVTIRLPMADTPESGVMRD
jgi:PAS domain S-box-containing protein